MARISYLSSLMEFNRRVLSQGDLPDDCSNITAADIKQLLFFDTVFIGNTTEMYQKFQMNGTMNEDYVEYLNHFISNVASSIELFGSIHQDVRFVMSDNFEGRLEVTRTVHDQIIAHAFELLGEARSYKYNPNTIYYLTKVGNGVIISFIDPKRDVYTKGIKRVINDKIYFYKTDYLISNFINDLVPEESRTIAVRVTTNQKSGKVSKVEFNGDMETMRGLVSMFPRDALIVSNPFIFTADIVAMVNSKIPNDEPERIPRFTPVDFDELFVTDRLIEFPNDSFDEYLQFLKSAAVNRNTVAIHLTLYRIGDDPAIFYILRDAVKRGIYVHVNIELMASGESINNFWMNEMLNAGIHVTTYACGKLKVHTKLTLIRFRNGRMVAQIGTGNYHTKTTKQYTDLCLITSNPEICTQALNVFTIFTGEEKMDFTKKFLVTRYNAREELLNLIAKQGKCEKDGFIALKCNAIDDPQITDALENAARKGCNIDMVVRGVCTWVPQEYPNVRIKSIIWDKLEHSRVYCFGKTNPQIYMGSLDLVTHKLDRRIETLVKIDDPDIMVKVCAYLNRYITNTSEAWIQTSSGMYIKET